MMSTPILPGTSLMARDDSIALQPFWHLDVKGEKSSIRFGICMGSHKLAISLTLYACDLWLLVVVNYLLCFMDLIYVCET
jgi:hypothetical protein